MNILLLPYQIDPNPPVNGTYKISCRDHIASYYIFLDVLLIAAFVYGLYIFKRTEVPQADLSAFSEDVSYIIKYLRVGLNNA